MKLRCVKRKEPFTERGSRTCQGLSSGRESRNQRLNIAPFSPLWRPLPSPCFGRCRARVVPLPTACRRRRSGSQNFSLMRMKSCRSGSQNWGTRQGKHMGSSPGWHQWRVAQTKHRNSFMSLAAMKSQPKPVSVLGPQNTHNTTAWPCPGHLQRKANGARQRSRPCSSSRRRQPRSRSSRKSTVRPRFATGPSARSARHCTTSLPCLARWRQKVRARDTLSLANRKKKNQGHNPPGVRVL